MTDTSKHEEIEKPISYCLAPTTRTCDSVITLGALEIQNLSGYPYIWRVVLTLALWAVVWVGIWVKPTPKVEADPGQKATTGNKPALNIGDHSQSFQAETMIVNTGVSPEKYAQDTLDAYNRGVQDTMAKVQKEKGEAIGKENPIGYSMVTITPTNQIVPLQEQTSRPLTVSWEKAKVEMTSSFVVIHMPDISFDGGAIAGNTFKLTRQINAFAAIAFDPVNGSLAIGNVIEGSAYSAAVVRIGRNPSVELSAKIVRIDDNGVVIVVGLKPYVEPPPIRWAN